MSKELNAARTKNEQPCAKYAAGSLVERVPFLNAAGVRFSFQRVLLVGRGGVVVGRSLAVSVLINEKEIFLFPKNNQYQVRAAIADEHSTYACMV